ncbi:hypothetical protein FNF27_04515 [Cafeteria roenbergensis]|uniref:SF4 helicase domain-containing protein n=1 Tax=Cafeteria roenbergensis TaxID=33653 RepID=A0A5A8E9M8_CAFRO|nr:hypothetical protein FNF27_04515 [Cafeteria roenbergensis]
MSRVFARSLVESAVAPSVAASRVRGAAARLGAANPRRPGARPASSAAPSTFVSSHFELDPQELSRVVSAHGLVSKDTAEHLIVKECPLCKRPARGKADNLWKLYIKKSSGAFFCHRCGSGGSWFDLKRHLKGKGAADSLSAPGGSASPAAEGPGARLATVEGVLGASRSLLDEGRFPSVLQFLTEQRGLSEATLRRYAVGGASWRFADETAALPASAPGLSEPLSRQVARPGGVAAAAAAARPSRQAGSAAPAPPTRLSTVEFREHACVVLPWGESEAGASATAAAEALMRSAQAVRGERDAGSAAAAAAAASNAARAGLYPALSSSSQTGRAGLAGLSESLASVARVKLRSVTDKRHQAMAPRGGGWGLFGAHTVPQDASAVVVTEGEFDAMAVHQATGAFAVSLPNGARSLPVQLLPWFERFQRLYLWMDEDGPGWEGAQMMARKLGTARSFLVRTSDGAPHVPGHLRPEGVSTAEPGADLLPASTAGGAKAAKAAKDANDALRTGGDLAASLLAAKPLPHTQVVTFRDLRSAVVHEVTDREALSGDPIRVLPSLQALVKGHRRGELTVLTGPTGAGKTTLLSQLSVDLAAQGVPTLWGSFEVKATRLLRAMMHQYVGRSLDGLPRAEVEAAADAFERLPITFMRYFGPTEVDDVIDAMQYATYAHDTAHIVLDNLQFMMSGSARGMDRFEAQEAAIHKFRAFASEANVHVTLVIHPRKERDGETLAMHSVFGSAKATQEADTVLILQNVNGSKAVDVRKNRFDGGTGSVPLVFDPAAMMYREKGSEPIRGGIASLLSARDADSDTLPGLRAAGGAAAVSAEGARAALQALGLSAAAVVVDGDEDLVVVEPDAASADVTTEWPEDDILTG